MDVNVKETAKFFDENSENEQRVQKTVHSTICLCISLILNVILTLAGVILTLFLLNVWKSNSSSPNVDKYSVCMACSETFAGGESVDWERIRGPEDEDELCCIKDAEYLQYLVRTVYLRDRVEKTSASGRRSPRHLPISNFKSRIGINCFINTNNLTGNSNLNLAWDCDTPAGQGTAFQSGGIIYDDGKILVPESGHYYIYSFLTYTNVHLATDEKINHYMRRKNPYKPRSDSVNLLMSKQTRQAGSLHYQTSFLGSAVRLTSGDAISVDVTNSSAIYTMAVSNFFGVFKL